MLSWLKLLEVVRRCKAVLCGVGLTGGAVISFASVCERGQLANGVRAAVARRLPPSPGGEDRERSCSQDHDGYVLCM
jgi:hypothetical protein